MTAFVPSEPLILGLDDTTLRRTRAKISAKGMYRDPVRSSCGHFVKASGFRWLSLLMLSPIPWANGVWALRFLTARVPSQRYNEEHDHRHKTLTVWARHMLRVVQRPCPGRQLIVGADSAYAVIKWLFDLQQDRPITVVTRLRLDAAQFPFSCGAYSYVDDVILSGLPLLFARGLLINCKADLQLQAVRTV